MAHRRLAGLFAALVALEAACGGGASTTAPSATTAPAPRSYPAGTTIKVTSGETGQPVSAARVVIGGIESRTNGDGTVTLDREVAFGTQIDIIAAGFLDRQARIQSSSTTFALWPRTSPTGMDEGFTLRMVYTSASDNVRQVALSRPAPGTTSVVIFATASVQREPLYMAGLAEAARLMTTATGINYTVSTTAGQLTVEIEPSENATSSCSANVSGFYAANRITLCWANWNPDSPRAVIYRNPSATTQRGFSVISLHEIGHSFGLQHNILNGGPAPGVLPGVMEQFGTVSDFNAREKLAIRLMLERRSGNTFPDSELSLSASSNVGDPIACPIVLGR